MAELTDEEIDKIIKEEIGPDILLDSPISKEANDRLGEMGFLWDVVNKKLAKDKICFDCKKSIDIKKDSIHIVPATTEKGVVAFVGLCDKCFNKLKENDNSKNTTKKN